METVVDLTINLLMMVGVVYVSVGFFLEMIDRWNQLDPETLRARAQAKAQAKALAAKPQPALPAATVSSVEVKARELQPVVVESKAID